MIARGDLQRPHIVYRVVPYNGVAPLGHGSTSCIRPPRAGPPYGHGSTRCIRPSVDGRAHLTGTAAKCVSPSFRNQRLNIEQGVRTAPSCSVGLTSSCAGDPPFASTAPRPRSCSVGMFTLVLCRPGLIRLPRTYALMCTYLGRILLFENAYKSVPLFPRTCSYRVYKIQFDSNDKLCAWCSWSKRSCRLCSACPNSERKTWAADVSKRS